jgi:hypothetical protein
VTGASCTGSYQVTPPGRTRVDNAALRADRSWPRQQHASVDGGSHPKEGAAYIVHLTVDEIADMVVFLLSDRSGVVTGSVLDWDQHVLGAYD